MKGEKKKTFTYATPPTVKDKAAKMAEKEGLTLSEKIDQMLKFYISRTSKMAYFDNMGELLIQESNKKKK
jgi:antitoxin component of RelBE/YafQ-DinJ toxin-antitoxin module